VLGQLDYLEDAQRVSEGTLHIHARELISTAMLLLECTKNSTFRRVGIASNYRSDFFAGAIVDEIMLV